MVKRLDVLNSQVLPDEAQERPTVCLNPDVAVKLGLKKGDRIQVESSKDKMEAILKISHKTRKDAVEFYPSVWKDDKGGINRLRNSIISDIGPTAAVNETKVTIRKV
jgi:anaerobic selenocysteine-containing dehydrogenase